MSARRFEGKVAIVTGAAHGIGRATAERLGSEGASLAVVDLNREGVEAEAARLESLGITAVPFCADVSQPAAVAGFVAGTLSRFGHIDVLHNNAGRLRAGSVTTLDLDEWELTFAVNVRSIMLGCREVIPAMRARDGGAIVNTASSSGLVGEQETPAYNASKAAIINLTRQLAMRLLTGRDPRQLRLSRVDPDRLQRSGARTPLRRGGRRDGALKRSARASGDTGGDRRGRRLPRVRRCELRGRPCTRHRWRGSPPSAEVRRQADAPPSTTSVWPVT